MSRTRPTSGHRATRNQRARRLAIAQAADEPCALCGQPIDYETPYDKHNPPPGYPTVHHLHRIADGGTELTTPDLLAPAHLHCNVKDGRDAQARRAATAKRARTRRGRQPEQGRFSPEAPGNVPAPRLRLSPGLPDPGTDLAEWPEWAATYARDCPVPPRFATRPLPEAVGSHGPEMIQFAAEHMGIELRPWQRLAAALGLAHGSDGRLLNRRVGVSVPRQVGKSWLLRALAGWRIHAAELFGEPQTVLHVSHSLNTTEEVFVPALLWAKRLGLKVREANGQMRIEGPDGSRWVPRSTQTGHGFSLSLALVDEAWSVAPRRVDSTYAPTLSERSGGQVWLFSSASQEASPLFPSFRAARRDGWCLVEWSAPAGAGWEWLARATPVPLTADREALCADEFASDAATFGFERLNRWPEAAGVPVGLLTEALWASLTVLGDGPVLGAGLEAERGESPVLALCRGVGGRLVVSVEQCGSVADAIARCGGLGVRPRVGRSLLADPGWAPLSPVGESGTARDVVGEFRRLASEGVIGHDGGPLLARVVAGWRGGTGDRADAMKASVWAVRAAREPQQAPPAVF